MTLVVIRGSQENYDDSTTFSVTRFGYVCRRWGKWLRLQHIDFEATEREGQMGQRGDSAAAPLRSTQQLDRNGKARGCAGAGSVRQDCRGTFETAERNTGGAGR